MTAGKDETEAVVLNFLILVRRLVDVRLEVQREVFLGAVEARPPAHSVDSFEARGGNEPRARFIRYAGLRPSVQGNRKGFVHRLLCKIKITEQADQSCQDSSRIHAIKGVEQFAYLLGGMLGHDTLGHDDDLSKPATPNQFGKRRIDALRSRQSAPVVTLKSGQQNASSVDSKSPMRSLSFVPAQHYRVALGSRAIRKLNHKKRDGQNQASGTRGMYEMG